MRSAGLVFRDGGTLGDGLESESLQVADVQG